MKERLNVLFVAPEVAPFARTGAVADVTGGLPKALKELGHDVRVITPQYRVINERRYVLRDVIRLQNIEVQLAGEPVQFHVKSAFLPHTKVQVYFLNHRPYFFREGLYADPETGEAYEDNDRRFELLALGALETLHRLRWQPDVIHCHDWPSSLVPFLLKTRCQEDAFFQKTCTVLTVHDWTQGGALSPQAIERLTAQSGNAKLFKGVPDDMLSLGLQYAQAVTIASSPAHPDLADAARKRLGGQAGKLPKIVNGFDGCRWNPETDPHLKSRFSADSLDGKAESRRRLLDAFGFTADQSREATVLTVWGQGEDGLLSRKKEILSLAQAGWTVLLFTEEEAPSQGLQELMAQSDARLFHVPEGDEAALHRVLSGADALWLTSPVGIEEHLHQVGLRYGAKTFIDFSIDDMRITSVEKKVETPGCYSGETGQVVKALADLPVRIRDRETWNAFVAECMRLSYSWETAALEYEVVYRRCGAGGHKA